MRRNGKLRVRSKIMRGPASSASPFWSKALRRVRPPVRTAVFDQSRTGQCAGRVVHGLSVPHDQGGDANPDRRRAEREHTGYRRRDRRSVRYGKKEAFTGSATVIKSDDIAKSQQSNVAQALAGKVAGVQLTNTSGQPGESPKSASAASARSTPATIRSGSWTACPTRVT